MKDLLSHGKAIKIEYNRIQKVKKKILGIDVFEMQGVELLEILRLLALKFVRNNTF